MLKTLLALAFMCSSAHATTYNVTGTDMELVGIQYCSTEFRCATGIYAPEQFQGTVITDVAGNIIGGQFLALTLPIDPSGYGAHGYYFDGDISIANRSVVGAIENFSPPLACCFFALFTDIQGTLTPVTDTTVSSVPLPTTLPLLLGGLLVLRSFQPRNRRRPLQHK